MSALGTGERWQVGSVTITTVVESEWDLGPAGFLFPDATADDVRAHPDLVPDYADADGQINGRIQAFVIEQGDRVVLVDPCVGNGKTRALPNWHLQDLPFMERFTTAGFTPERVDLVAHTHLHADHVGWDTHLVDGEWVPTFTSASYLFTQRELDGRAGDPFDGAAIGADTIDPIFAAGLGQVVDEDADLGGGLTLEPSTGHTAGHVSLWVRSEGEVALITGDFLHHPVQCHRPDLAEIADLDADQARATRRRMLARAAESGALVLGTHFARPAGRVVPDGDTWRFAPI